MSVEGSLYTILSICNKTQFNTGKVFVMRYIYRLTGDNLEIMVRIYKLLKKALAHGNFLTKLINLKKGHSFLRIEKVTSDFLTLN